MLRSHHDLFLLLAAFFLGPNLIQRFHIVGHDISERAIFGIIHSVVLSRAHGVVVSHPLSMREALGSIPSVSIFNFSAKHVRTTFARGLGFGVGRSYQFSIRRTNPATRNRTRDHLIAAAFYSQMLYQLSYSRSRDD